MFNWIKNWLNRPSVKERVLSVMPTEDWISGLDIHNQSKVSIPGVYFATDKLIDEGLIHFKWDRTGLHTRGGRKRKMFRKI